jgi:hypothetical protein
MNLESLKQRTFDLFNHVSTETLGWLTVLVLHGATFPSLLAMMNGLTTPTMPIDLILLIWTALILLFIKATIQRDMLNLVTIGLGFFAQATALALIFFK